ncbi:Troponin I [Halotydeus destructor]|nr:Troponin I [Halotydeus destructor]
MDEKEKRKAEVRARLEQAAASKKKRGFMTPARKKKLRNLIRALAAEELKREQARKAEERARILAERTGAPKNIDNANEAELMAICKEYFERLHSLEGDKYDLEYSVSKKDYVKNDLALKVNHVRGKFQKPALKKVSKAQAQMEKIKMFAAKANQMDHRMGLKSVQKFAIKEEKEDVKDKPDWAGGPQAAKESAEGEEE